MFQNRKSKHYQHIQNIHIGLNAKFYLKQTILNFSGQVCPKRELTFKNRKNEHEYRIQKIQICPKDEFPVKNRKNEHL